MDVLLFIHITASSRNQIRFDGLGCMTGLRGVDSGKMPLPYAGSFGWLSGLQADWPSLSPEDG